MEDVFPKLADDSGKTPTIKDNPPYLYHHLERGEAEFYERIEEVFLALPRIVAGRPAGSAGPVCREGQGHQGGGRRQRGHALQRRALDGW